MPEIIKSNTYCSTLWQCSFKGSTLLHMKLALRVIRVIVVGNDFSTTPKNLPQGFPSSYDGQLHRAATAKLSLVWWCSRSSSGPTQGLCVRKIVATQEVVASRWQPVLSTMSRWCGGLRSSFAQYSDPGCSALWDTNARLHPRVRH